MTSNRALRTVATMAAVAAVLATAATALIVRDGGTTRRTATQSQARHARVRPGSATTSLAATTVALPSGFSVPANLAGDPNKPGVWFIGENANELRLFNMVSSSVPATSYLLGNPSQDLLTVAQNAVMVDKAGIVWVGVNDHLFRVNPAQGGITETDLPATTSFGQLATPPGASNLSAITSIAEFGGTVAVGSSFSTAISIVDTSSGKRVSSVAIPPGTVTSLAYAPDGTLIATDEGVPPAGSFSFTGLKLVGSAPGATSASILQSTPYSGSFAHAVTTGVELWTASSNDLSSLTVSHVNATPTASAAAPVPMEAGLSPYAQGLDAAVSDNLVVAATHDGAEVLNLTGSPVGSISLSPVSCGDEAGVGVIPQPGTSSTTAVSQTATCPRIAKAMTVDAAGNVWLIPSASDELIVSSTR